MIPPVGMSGTFPTSSGIPASSGLGGTSASKNPASFASHLVTSLANQQTAATSQTEAFAQGSGTNLGTVMTTAAEADMQAQAFSLLVSKALAAYQSIMNMQV